MCVCVCTAPILLREATAIGAHPHAGALAPCGAQILDPTCFDPFCWGSFVVTGKSKSVKKIFTDRLGLGIVLVWAQFSII